VNEAESKRSSNGVYIYQTEYFLPAGAVKLIVLVISSNSVILSVRVLVSYCVNSFVIYSEDSPPMLPISGISMPTLTLKD